MLHTPKLPPKPGYTERISPFGTPYYYPTPERERELAEAAKLQSVRDDTDALMVDHELRLTMLELGLTE